MNMMTALQNSVAARIQEPGESERGDLCGIAVCGITGGPMTMESWETYALFQGDEGKVFTASVDDVLKAKQVSHDTWELPRQVRVTLLGPEDIEL